MGRSMSLHDKPGDEPLDKPLDESLDQTIDEPPYELLEEPLH
jgi:hypothetical protein